MTQAPLRFPSPSPGRGLGPSQVNGASTSVERTAGHTVLAGAVGETGTQTLSSGTVQFRGGQTPFL